MKRAARASSSGKRPVAAHVSRKKPNLPPARVRQDVERGLAFGELEALREQLELPMEQLAAALGISRPMLHQRKTSRRLTSDESDKVVRYARLFGRAVHLLGGLDEARQWLKAPQRGLGGAVPLEYAQTEVGAREVENLLGRI